MWKIVFEEIMAENLPNLVEKLGKSQQDEPKEIHTQAHHNQIDEKQRQRKVFKAARGKGCATVEGNKSLNSWITQKGQKECFKHLKIST